MTVQAFPATCTCIVYSERFSCVCVALTPEGILGFPFPWLQYSIPIQFHSDTIPNRNHPAGFLVCSLMPQIQRHRISPTRSRLKSAFWGRDSITMTLVLYLVSGVFTSNFVAAPIACGLGDIEAIGNTQLGAMSILALVFILPALVAGWVTGYFTPRWSLVSWVVMNVLYFWFRMLPELQAMWSQEAWQFWPMLLIILMAFGLQTLVLFATRRRVIHRLSTSCG